MSEEFSFRDRGDSSGAVSIAERWERESIKLLENFFGEMPEIFIEELELARF